MQYRNFVIAALLTFQTTSAHSESKEHYQAEIKKAAVASVEKRIYVKSSSYLQMWQQFSSNMDSLRASHIKGPRQKDFIRRGDNYLRSGSMDRCLSRIDSLKLLKEAMEEEARIPSRERKSRMQTMHRSVMNAAYRAEACVEEKNRDLRSIVNELNEMLGYQGKA